MKRVAILGSTGSIGQSALAVVAAHPDRLRVVALSAGENVPRFVEQVAQHAPDTVAMATSAGLAEVQAGLRSLAAAPQPATIACGAEGLIAVATHPDADVVLFASSGTAALDAVLAAIECGKTIALANKETLVMAGSIVMGRARQRGVTILPVDSEHNAIFQCVHGREAHEVRRVVLTASGGPFRELSRSRLPDVTADGALGHPTWRMGPKITIDSATLMNKGLEVIEAHWLFDVTGRANRRRHPSAIDRALDGRARRRFDHRAARRHRHAPARLRTRSPIRALGGLLPAARFARAGRLEFEPPDTVALPLPGSRVPGARRRLRATDRLERGQ